MTEDDELLENIGAAIVMSNRRFIDPLPALPKAILVGEANPYGGDPDFALFPEPAGSTGHRLCHKILGLARGAYLRDYGRANLCGSAWSLPAARRRAARLADGAVPLVLLGAKVARAFGVAYEPFTQGTGFALCGARTPWVVLPHPSGLNRLWNANGAFLRARQAVADCVARGAVSVR